ncbi:MAG: PhnE/PtxC family ABC transporter permease, partial [Candidatus Bipolaricaulaceae bacterium]
MDITTRLARGLRIGILPALLDLAFLGYLWMAVSISYGYFRFGRIHYSFFPWTTMLLVIVPVAAFWSAWDQTVGLKVVNHELKGGSAAKRFLYALTWPLFPLTVLTAPFDPEGRSPAELLSGLELSEVALIVYRPWCRSLTGWLTALVLLSTLAAAWGVTRIDPSRLRTGFEKTLKFWRAIASPRWDLLSLGLRLLAETVFMAIMATAFAVPFAVFLSFLAARNLMRGPIARPIYTVLRMIGSFT